MTWVKIDEDFASHPKLMEAGPLGMAMQVAGLCYANRHKTDGHLAAAAVGTFLSFEGIGMRMWTSDMGLGGGEDAEWSLVVEDLIDAGVWHKAGHDCPDCPQPRWTFYIHHYLHYQPSKAEIEAERQKKVEAGKAGGRASAQARASARGGASAQAQGQAESKPDPVSDPVPETSSSSVGSSTGDPEEEERSHLFVEACALLAQRALAQQPPGSVKVAAKWLAATQAERMERHAEWMSSWSMHEGVTAEELADLLEPDPSKPRPALRRVYACERCKDTGQIQNDDDLTQPPLVPCPNHPPMEQFAVVKDAS